MAIKAKKPLADRIALVLLLLFMANDIMGGAFRFYAVRLGLSWFAFAPNLILALALLPMFATYILVEGVTSTYLTVFILFSISAAYGVFNLGNAAQVSYGLWSLVPFLTGIVVLPALIRNWKQLSPYALCLWAVAVAGVFINYFYTWPWIGFEYQLGTMSVSASRLWNITQFDLFRLPGFSQASYFVAPQILLLALFIKETVTERRVWIPIWVLSGVAIGLTTSKTLVLVFCFFSFVWLLRARVRHSLRLTPLFAAVVVVLLPVSMLIISVDWLSGINSPISEGLIATFVERMQVDWPDYIRMINNHGNLVLGRGLGGIGTAQMHFEPALFSPSDNIGVFLYATFGMAGVFVLFSYARKASRSIGDCEFHRFFFYAACVVLLVGTTLSVMDASLLGFIFGASFRFFNESSAVRCR